MVRTLFALFVAAHLSAASALAQMKAAAPGGKRLPSKTVRPQKPVTRSGIILVDVDYRSGRVTAARMFKSTGNPILDNAAVSGFQKAKFKPKTKSPIKVPISFTVTATQW